MSSMTDRSVPVVPVPAPAVEVVAGVDTHGDTHHAAVLSMIGGELGDREFPATAAGYTDLLDWLQCHGTVVRVGVEGTSSYGAGLTRFLHTRGVEVVEIDRPDRRARRAVGKSDPLDAYAAARTVLAGARVVVPKAGTGIVEAIRVLRITRRGAVKARTQTANQLRSLLVTAPPEVRERFTGLKTPALVRACAKIRIAGGDLSDPARAVRVALRRLARRHMALTAEIREADRELRPLVNAAAPGEAPRV